MDIITSCHTHHLHPAWVTLFISLHSSLTTRRVHPGNQGLPWLFSWGSNLQALQRACALLFRRNVRIYRFRVFILNLAGRGSARQDHIDNFKPMSSCYGPCFPEASKRPVMLLRRITVGLTRTSPRYQCVHREL